MFVFSVIITSFLIISISLIAAGNIRKMNLKKWALYIFAIFYGIIFLFVFMCNALGLTSDYNSSFISNFNYKDLFLYLISAILIIFGICTGYKCKIKKITIGQPIKLYYNNLQNFYRKLFNFSIFIFLVGFFSYYLYSIAYGGLIGILNHTVEIRNGVSLYNKWSFLQKLGPLVEISSYCFFIIFTNISTSISLKLKSLVFWLLSFSFTIFMSYSLGGRGYMVVIFLIYLLIFILRKTNNLHKIIVKYGFLFSLGLIIFLAMNAFWERSDNGSIISVLADGFSYLFVSSKVAFSNLNYRYFQDFLYIPLYFLPSSIWLKMGIKTTNQFNTFLTFGGYKGEVVNGSLISGEATTGMLSFSYLQFGLLGIIFVAFLFGIVLRYIDDILIQMNDGSYKTFIYAYSIVQFIYQFISGGDICALILSNLCFIIFYVLFRIYLNISMFNYGGNYD